MSLPERMRAAVLIGHGAPEALVWRQDMPLPKIKPGEALVRVLAAGVNNTDIATREGWYAREGTEAGGWAGALTFPRIQGGDLCGHHQFYPRPFCLSCEADTMNWVESKGRGTIYSATTVRLPVTDELPPPYVVAIVELDEGPRFLTNVKPLDARIGDVVQVAWRERGELPPLPVFRRAG